MKTEKMYMMNVVGNISYVDDVVSDILDSKAVDLADALSQIENNSFVFSVNDENLEKTIDFNYTRSFEKTGEDKELQDIADGLIKSLDLDLNKQIKFDPKYYNPEEIKDYNDRIKVDIDRLNEINRQLEDGNILEENFALLSGMNVEVEKLQNLEYFTYKIGMLAKDDRLKLKKNYENILATIFHLGAKGDSEIYLAIYPNEVSQEIERILRSLNWKEVVLPEGYTGTADEIITSLRQRDVKLNEEKASINGRLKDFLRQQGDNLVGVIKSVYNKTRLEQAKNKLARSKKFFYLSGWIGEKSIAEMKQTLEKYPDILVQFKDSSEVPKLIPPTKLNNNSFFKPFELLVKMYGTPNYKELDPTPFFAITYMIMFGAMFGDLGQGLLIVLAGFYTKRKINDLFGGILMRVGISSMIFGLLYGSVFGLETIIPALLIRPYDNINITLIASVIFGVVLLTIVYVFGIYNNLFYNNNVEDGFFGKDGIAGFALYIVFLLVGGSIATGKEFIPVGLGLGLMILLIFIIIFKLPLSHLYLNVRPLHKGTLITDYYVEETFASVETLLAVFSNTLSFLRIGAFALNHVGLFLAFTTIGAMIGTQMGNISMIIFGNALIMVLEGLIVFIQVLRLEYYELFSHFYKGDGIEFVPSTKIYY